MSNTNKTAKTTKAQAAFDLEHEKVLFLLEELKALHVKRIVESRKACAAKNPEGWQYVADMAHAKNLLASAVAFLSGEGEPETVLERIGG